MTSDSFGLDLSYLTTDERRIIDDVLRRQQEEEERNTLILRDLQEDYDRIAQAVRHRLTADPVDPVINEQPTDLRTVAIPNGSSNCYSPVSPVEAALMCQICRTHIPDIPIEGIRLAHCHYCGLRVCYRCGTTLTYKAKTVWTCALCKKRHELLVKTGQWAATASEFDAGFTAAAFRRTHTRSRSQEPRPLVITTPRHVSRAVHGQIVPLPGQPLDLRRHISTSSAQLNSLPDVAEWTSDVTQQYTTNSPKPHFSSAAITNSDEQTSWQNSAVAEQRRPNSTVAFTNNSTAGFHRRTAADRVSATLPRQGSLRAAQSLPRLSLGSLAHLPTQFQTAISSNRQVGASTQLHHNCSEAAFVGSLARLVHDATSGSISNNNSPTTVLVTNGRTASSSSLVHNNTPNSTPVFSLGRSALRRSKLAAMGHQDSLSSDPSSDYGGGMAHSSSSASYVNASPNFVQHGGHQSRNNYSNRRSYFAQCPQTSISSSEDDMRSTPDYLTESDLEFEIESGSVSERGELDNFRPGAEPSNVGRGTIPLGAMTGSGVVDPLTCGNFSQTLPTRTSPRDALSSLRAKAVRFQRGSSVDCAFPVTRDSGIETASSTQTLNEDGSKFRMDWQRSADGTKLIGKFSILRNNRGESSSRILGLKVVGGRLADNGQLGAIVTKVKQGSVADTVGRLRPGDKVIEWNGVKLQDLSFDQVYDVIGSTRDCRRLDLLVHRSLLGRLQDEADPQSRTAFFGPRRHSVTFNTIASSSAMQQLTAQFSQPETDQDAGRLQLRLWLDSVRSELTITVVSARDLLPVSVAAATAEPPPHAFCVITLLPNDNSSDMDGVSLDKSTSQKGIPSRRWTNRHPPSWEPRWDQIFTLWPVSTPSNSALDAAVYDAQPPDGCCESESSLARCIGCVSLQLCEIPLNNEPYWYRLTKPEPGSRSGPGIIPPMMSISTTSQSLVDVRSAATTAVNVVMPKPAIQTQQKQSQMPQPAQQVSNTWQQVSSSQNMQSGVGFPSQQVQQMYTAPVMDQSTQQMIQPQMPCWSMPSDQNFQPMFGQSAMSQMDPNLMTTQPQVPTWNFQPDGSMMQTLGGAMVQPLVGLSPPQMTQSWPMPSSDGMMFQQMPMMPPILDSNAQQQMMQPQMQGWNMPNVPALPAMQTMPPITATLPTTDMPMYPQQQPIQPLGQQIAASVTVHQPGSFPNQQFATPMSPEMVPQMAPFIPQQPVAPVMSLSPPPVAIGPAIAQQLQQPAAVMTPTQQQHFPAFAHQQQPLPAPLPAPILAHQQPIPMMSPQQPQSMPIPIAPVTKQEVTSPLLETKSLSSSNLPGQGAESEPEYGIAGDDTGGRLYRKHSQTGVTAPNPASSLGRRVARHRSDASIVVAAGAISASSSGSSMEPVEPPVPNVPPPIQMTQTSSQSQITPPAPSTPSGVSEGDKSKRHVRLAPEVSFIVGNDEPPISMPLASESSFTELTDHESKTTSASVASTPTGSEPAIKSSMSSALRRVSMAPNSSESSMHRVSSMGEASVLSDAESAVSGNEGTSEGEMGSRSNLSTMRQDESDAASGGEHSSGKEDGGSNDPTVLAARLQKKSLWGKAAKKSLIKLAGKSAFPNVVDSVMAQNLAKQKKKSGINRCGDEVVTQPTSSSSGFDMSAGFFDGDLGPGQVVGRQMLGATAIGELEIGLRQDSSSHLVVTLVAARDLLFKHKTAPSIYAKAALVVGQSTQERQKSVPQQVRDCDPQLGIEFAFQTTPYNDKMLQVSLWAVYGKMSGRQCLGAVAIKLEEIKKLPLRASYKLYDPAAVGGFVTSIATEGPGVGLM